MKKSASKNPANHQKAGTKHPGKSDPVAMVELRGQIISDHNKSIRNFNETHQQSSNGVLKDGAAYIK